MLVACSDDSGNDNPVTGVTAGTGASAAGTSANAAAGTAAVGTAGTGSAAVAGRAGSTTAGSGGAPNVTPPPGGTAGTAAAGGGAGTASNPMAGAGAAGTGTTMPEPPVMGEYEDPGTNDWPVVPEAEVAEKCKMDIQKLKSTGLSHKFAVFRYGKLCYQQGTDSATMVFSATKSLGGIVTASVAYLLKDVPKTGPGTGTFNDYDLASDWGLSSYRQGMQLAFLMSMATGSRGLEWGMRSFSYDTVGAAGLNNMGNVANRALMQQNMSGVANMRAATARLFQKLGMKTASWDSVTYGTGSMLTLKDMGKLFTLIIHDGVYNKERLIGTDWIYRMTHPALEDANTSYGEFMWLNHRGNATGIGGDISSGSNSPNGDPCAPAAFWQKYPHKVSNAPDCQATVAGAKCEQKYDIGVYSAQGLGGQFIIGHPGLDMVLTIKDYSGMGGPMGFWEKIRPAVVALDPMFKGDEKAFCAAYGAGDYAPDLKHKPTQPPDPP
ncbi:MAG TPA: hypothetical protein VJR89_00075 [Polyangiales bacterium]|nr:hypothetical protein [Polyangiales bacterium]